MQTRNWTLGLVLIFVGGRAALGQSPTPTPVDSNIAVSTYAQGRGNPCSGGPASLGCGGCYPGTINTSDPTSLLATVNPEWQPIGPMIPGGDPSLPPASEPVLVTGSIALSKINEGGDFPASHISDDQNTFITLDPDKNGLIATGNGGPTSCPGEGCSQVEMEREIGKYPLFAWAGEGDRIAAVGRWIFDCGHPDADPTGKCSNSSATACVLDGDCPSGGTCTNPAPVFNYRAELHPPQAIAVIRNKSNGKTPATRADVYISADAGGAGDTCTVTHLASFADLLTPSGKLCFLNHCSGTTTQSCLADTDCPKKQTCVRLDPTQGVIDVNASDFQFDVPLPANPGGATKVAITTKKMKVPSGSVMPKATFVPDLAAPTPVVHVTVPMTQPVGGKMPNVFAQEILASWKGDKTKLPHVQVKLTKLTVNNPLKPLTPVIHNCTNPMGGALTSTQCLQDSDCPTGSTCDIVDAPGWGEYGQVNGDWIQFAGLDQLGARNQKHPPTYPLAISQKFKFDEYVAADGTIHIATTGHSLNCIDTLYGQNLIVGLNTYGLTLGADCLLDGMDANPGRIDVSFAGPDFTTPSGTPTTCTPSGTLVTCTTTSTGGDGGTCTSGALCISDADCPTGETCTVTSGAFSLTYTLQVK